MKNVSVGMVVVASVCLVAIVGMLGASLFVSSGSPKQAKNLPAFRDHEFGKPLTINESMKLVDEDGREKRYEEKVDGEDLEATATYETVDGILHAATLRYKKPYSFQMESALRDKMGRPQDYEVDRQEWEFDDGSVSHYSNCVDYRSDYCWDYFSEQIKARNNKLNDAL